MIEDGQKMTGDPACPRWKAACAPRRSTLSAWHCAAGGSTEPSVHSGAADAAAHSLPPVGEDPAFGTWERVSAERSP